MGTSESVVTRYKEGRPYRVWTVPNGKRNEALDCRVYAYAARQSLTETQIQPSPVKAENEAARHRIEETAKLAIAARAATPVRQRGPPGPVRASFAIDFSSPMLYLRNIIVSLPSNSVRTPMRKLSVVAICLAIALGICGISAWQPPLAYAQCTPGTAC
ncbi:terminase gpA endonuclease subunit [Mesorhizobium sp.]|uniref:terminase gpA endonuclease subunit n=1 Tax=Mesorhizobium sp. TaxID=1871066 RepID=UPI00257D218F|nr:terminase gpA endonuclease subunit [Mesorhizobium sp.]